MRIALASVFCASAAFLTTGCAVHVAPYPVVYRTRPVEVVEVEPEAPVIAVTPGEVVIVDVEPAPVQRVYVYEQGFPPGCYLYGGFYYYGGYRYRRDVFVERYVTINVREHRYVDVERNRQVGRTFEERHRTEYVKYGARHESHPSVVTERKRVEHTNPDPRRAGTERQPVQDDRARRAEADRAAADRARRDEAVRRERAADPRTTGHAPAETKQQQLERQKREDAAKRNGEPPR